MATNTRVKRSTNSGDVWVNSMADPGFQFPIGQDIYQNLIQQAIAAATAPRPSPSDILAEGVNSPLLQMIIQRQLASLIPGEEQAREGLTEQFRAAGAGALRSGAYGREVGRQESALQGKRGDAVTQAMLQFLGPLLQAELSARGQDIQASGIFSDLLGRLPNPVFRDPTGAGLVGGVGGGGGSTAFGQDRSSWLGSASPQYTANVQATRQGGSTPGFTGAYQPPQTLDLDAIIRGASFSPSPGLASNRGSSGFFERAPMDFIQQPAYQDDIWQGVMGQQDWANFFGE